MEEFLRFKDVHLIAKPLRLVVPLPIQRRLRKKHVSPDCMGTAHLSLSAWLATVVSVMVVIVVGRWGGGWFFFLRKAMDGAIQDLGRSYFREYLSLSMEVKTGYLHGHLSAQGRMVMQQTSVPSITSS